MITDSQYQYAGTYTYEKLRVNYCTTDNTLKCCNKNKHNVAMCLLFINLDPSSRKISLFQIIFMNLCNDNNSCLIYLSKSKRLILHVNKSIKVNIETLKVNNDKCQLSFNDYLFHRLLVCFHSITIDVDFHLLYVCYHS